MEYEDLVKIMGFLSAASDIAFGREDELPEGFSNDLTTLRNRINVQRLSMLGNGQNRPFDVSDLVSGSGV